MRRAGQCRGCHTLLPCQAERRAGLGLAALLGEIRNCRISPLPLGLATPDSKRVLLGLMLKPVVARKFQAGGAVLTGCCPFWNLKASQ